MSTFLPTRLGSRRLRTVGPPHTPPSQRTSPRGGAAGPRAETAGRLRAALLSLLWPGAGQLYAGGWHRGLVLVFVTLGVAVLALVPLLAGTAHVAGLLVRPVVLAVVLALDLGILAFRVFAVVDAYRLVHRRQRSARRRKAGVSPGGAPETRTPVRWSRARSMLGHCASAAALAIVVAVTALPHVAVGYYDVQARSVLSEVFLSPASPPWSQPKSIADVTHPESALLRRHRVTVLLIGGDAGPLRQGLRTDTLVVLSLAPRTGEAALFSIPRNLVNVPLPRWVDSPWRCRCFPHPVNELHQWAEDHPDAVPDGMDPGPGVLSGAVAELLGIGIDYHVLTDLRGFVEAVDAIGGVDVNVTNRIYDQLDSPDGSGRWDAIDLHPGRHHLDGHAALVYVRTRRNSDDYARMYRQRCFLATLASQAKAPTVLRAFPRLAAVARRSLSTDFPLDALPDLVKLVSRVDVRSVATVAFTPPAYVADWEDGYPVPDLWRIRRTVSALLLDVPVTASTPESTPSAPAAPVPAAPISRGSTIHATPTPSPTMGDPVTVAETCG